MTEKLPILEKLPSLSRQINVVEKLKYYLVRHDVLFDKK